MTSINQYFAKEHKFGSRNLEDPLVYLRALDNRTLVVEGVVDGPLAGSELANGKVLIGDNLGHAQERTISGDATISNTGTLTLATVPLEKGGTNANLTASNGGIVYSTESAFGILSGIATASKALLSQISSAPIWSAFTLPTNTGINKILYSSANDTVSDFGNITNSVLTTNASGQPQFTSEIKTGNGSAVYPMYAFANSITTGMWSGASNTIGWSINGSNRMTLAGTTLTVGQGAGAPFTIKALDAAIDGFNGSAITYQASNGLGTGNGGNVNINCGQCGTSGTSGGSFNLVSGLGNTTGGGMFFTSGSVTSGNNGTTGGVIISSAGGQGAGSQSTGNFTIQTGPSVGALSNSGSMNITTGAAENNSGNITLTGGASTSGTAGSIFLRTGGANTRMTIGGTGLISTTNTTAATSTTAASVSLAGGLGITKNIFFGAGTGLASATDTGLLFSAGQQNDFSIKTGGQSSWIDLPAQITARTTGSSAPSYTIWNPTHSNNMYGYEFPSSGTTKEIWAELHIPHEHTPGTGMFFHAHFLHNTASATGNVRLSFDYTSAKAPDNNYVHYAFSGTTTNTTATQAVGSAQYSHHITETSSAILAGSLEVDTVVLVRMTRDNTVASNFSGSIWILFCDAHISVSKVSTLNRSKQQASNSFYT